MLHINEMNNQVQINVLNSPFVSHNRIICKSEMKLFGAVHRLGNSNPSFFKRNIDLLTGNRSILVDHIVQVWSIGRKNFDSFEGNNLLHFRCCICSDVVLDNFMIVMICFPHFHPSYFIFLLWYKPKRHSC